MTSAHTTHLQRLLDCLGHGDETARQELLAGTYERLRLLARQMLRREFPRLEYLHQSASVVHRAALRLWQALTTVRPASVREFFNLAARQMRWVQLDLARRRPDRPLEEDRGSDGSGGGLVAPPEDPEALEAWESFHHQVAKLPDAEREVFELVWYHGLTQAEAAGVLNVHPREVSRRWLRARLRLIEPARAIANLLPK